MPTNTAKVVLFLLSHPGATSFDLADGLGLSLASVRQVINRLQGGAGGIYGSSKPGTKLTGRGYTHWYLRDEDDARQWLTDVGELQLRVEGSRRSRKLRAFRPLPLDEVLLFILDNPGCTAFEISDGLGLNLENTRALLRLSKKRAYARSFRETGDTRTRWSIIDPDDIKVHLARGGNVQLRVDSSIQDDILEGFESSGWENAFHLEDGSGPILESRAALERALAEDGLKGDNDSISVLRDTMLERGKDYLADRLNKGTELEKLLILRTIAEHDLPWMIPYDDDDDDFGSISQDVPKRLMVSFGISSKIALVGHDKYVGFDVPEDVRPGVVDLLVDMGYEPGMVRFTYSRGQSAMPWQMEDELYTLMNESVSFHLRTLISEIIRKCGDDYCLYTKHKQPNGKRRRLGKHSSLAGAKGQERAIHSH